MGYNTGPRSTGSGDEHKNPRTEFKDHTHIVPIEISKYYLKYNFIIPLLKPAAILLWSRPGSHSRQRHWPHSILATCEEPGLKMADGLTEKIREESEREEERDTGCGIL